MLQRVSPLGIALGVAMGVATGVATGVKCVGICAVTDVVLALVWAVVAGSNASVMVVILVTAWQRLLDFQNFFCKSRESVLIVYTPPPL